MSCRVQRLISNVKHAGLKVRAPERLGGPLARVLAAIIEALSAMSEGPQLLEWYEPRPGYLKRAAYWQAVITTAVHIDWALQSSCALR